MGPIPSIPVAKGAGDAPPEVISAIEAFVMLHIHGGNEFPLELAVPVDELQRRRVLLPTAFGECLWAAEECLDRLQDFLGVELTSVELTHTVELMTWEEVHG